MPAADEYNSPELLAAFRAAVAPAALALRGLVQTNDRDRRNAGHLPAPDARAMAELAEAELRFPALVEGNAAQHAHTLGTLLIACAGDHFEALVRLTLMDEPTLYADKVILRAGIEACAFSAWLLDERISCEKRIARGLIETLDAHRRMGPTVDGDLRERWDVRADEMRTAADAAGLEWIPTKGPAPLIAGERRPRVGQAMDALFGPGADNDDGDLGAFTQGYLSRFVHSSSTALMSVIDPAELEQASSLGPPALPASTNSSSINHLLTLSMLAYLRAAELQRRLMGWHSAEWRNAALVAQSAMRATT